MADQSDILSDQFDSNLSFEEIAQSGLLSVDANATSVSTGRTRGDFAKFSSIHQHTREVTEEDKLLTKKRYLCKYCTPDDQEGWHASTTGLRGHLKKIHDTVWSWEENESRTTVRDDGEKSIQVLYKTLLAKGEVQGLEGEVLRRTVQKGAIKQTLLDLIIVRRLPFSCVEWPEFHAFVKALNREAANPDTVPIHHSTITDWIHSHFTESQDVVRRILQSAKTNIHLAVDIWTSPNHSLVLGICASFLDIQDRYQNILIGLRTVHSQSGEDQWGALQPVLESYGIETRIGALVGDNAGSNDVLCRTIATWLAVRHNISWNAEHQRICCQGHVINLIVQAFLFTNSTNEKLMASYDEDDRKDEEEEEEEEMDDDNNDDEEQIEIEIVQRPVQTSTRGRGRGRGKGRGRGRGNQKHKAVELKQAVEGQAKAPAKKDPLSRKHRLSIRGEKIRELMGPLGKLHNNVVHIRSSANRTTWFKTKAGKVIPLDNRTRWNSWFHMLSVALQDQVKAGLQLYIEHYEKDIPTADILTTNDWIQLRTIHDFLNAFHDATLFLQGDRTTLERVLESIDTLQQIIQSTWVRHTTP